MKVRKIYPGLEELSEYERMLKDYKNYNKADYNKASHVRNLDLTKLSKNLDKNIALKLLVENAVLCNDAYYQDEKNKKISGDPTEIALLEMGKSLSISKNSLESKKPRRMEEPFDSIRKMMTTIHKIPEDNFFPEICNSDACQNSVVSSERSDETKVTKSENEETIKSRPKYILFSKGAPEVIIKKCSKIIKNNKIENLTDEDKREIQNINA